ncbi:ImmA/IrrE family metallo-endopeptidase [Microbacterium stercoris]|uniref:ImmA/IrrE family metallo-endopeptidase n=1 Tax=Microbacterium stercoris TaxID=2820289 RepID=A0A939QIS9_9MICO|nr:ImmA/IrrE family metallo-endopeptidase [Microbacterium stercoris]MBO3663694.1 ImmA/IrrE family metallo-endopeptidase [Microbacterium stercoris]
MKHLYDMARALGVSIEHADLTEHDRDGDYCAETNTIRLQQGMTRRLARSVLAHELAHAIFGDVPSMFGPVNAKQERRADEWAALRLITREDYRVAEALHGGHAPAIAVELDVMPDIVEAYQRVLLRVGDVVYTRPRMGAGQWDARSYVASEHVA